MIDKTFDQKIDGKKYYDREGAYLIAIQDGLVAVVKTPNGYFLIGGGIEDNENHVECICRECMEETGYRVVVNDYICSAQEYWVHEELGYFHPIQYYYSGVITDKIALTIETDHEFQWISTDDIEDKMFIRSQGWAIKTYLHNQLCYI